MPHYFWMDQENVYLYTMEFYSDMKKNEILSLQLNGWN
jgi:hypothetical protein